MANSIVKAKNYLADPTNLNSVYVAEAQLWFLMKEKFKIVNANTIMLPINHYSEEEIPDYDRGDGFETVDILRSWDTYKLTEDWGMELKMDSMDLEESLAEGIISFANDATRRLTVPRGDKYIGSQLYDNTGKYVIGAITKNNVLGEIDDAVVHFQNKGVTGNLHLLVTPEAAKHIRNAEGITRKLDVKDARTGITREIEYMDEIQVHTIKGKRLPDNINFYLISEDSIFGVVKHNPSYFYAAGTQRGIDADVVDMRLYFGFFILSNKKDGVYVHMKEGVNVTFALNRSTLFDGSKPANVVPATRDVIQVPIGYASGFPETPTSTTHNFVGWFTDENTFVVPYLGTEKINSDLTVYAKWAIKPGS